MWKVKQQCDRIAMHVLKAIDHRVAQDFPPQDFPLSCVYFSNEHHKNLPNWRLHSKISGDKHIFHWRNLKKDKL